MLRKIHFHLRLIIFLTPDSVNRYNLCWRQETYWIIPLERFFFVAIEVMICSSIFTVGHVLIFILADNYPEPLFITLFPLYIQNQKGVVRYYSFITVHVLKKLGKKLGNLVFNEYFFSSDSSCQIKRFLVPAIAYFKV